MRKLNHSFEVTEKVRAGSLQNLGLSNCGGSEQAPHSVPGWYADYSELKATLASGSRELAAPPLTTQENWN